MSTGVVSKKRVKSKNTLPLISDFKNASNAY